jgi:hypothetical protein
MAPKKKKNRASIIATPNNPLPIFLNTASNFFGYNINDLGTVHFNNK